MLLFEKTKNYIFFTFLGLEPRLNIKYGFNGAGKIERFSKVSLWAVRYEFWFVVSEPHFSM
jgi:hypothetical protein